MHFARPLSQLPVNRFVDMMMQQLLDDIYFMCIFNSWVKSKVLKHIYLILPTFQDCNVKNSLKLTQICPNKAMFVLSSICKSYYLLCWQTLNGYDKHVWIMQWQDHVWVFCATCCVFIPESITTWKSSLSILAIELSLRQTLQESFTVFFHNLYKYLRSEMRVTT